MATATKTQSKGKGKTQDEFPEDAATQDRGTVGGSSAVTIRGGSVEPLGEAGDLSAVLDQIDPQAVKTEAADMVGHEVIVFAWTTHAGNEKYRREDGTLGDYAVLGFYFAEDPERKARFLTTGGARIVPVVQAAIQRGVQLPMRTTLASYQAKRGIGYRFARKDESVAPLSPNERREALARRSV